MPFRDNNNNGTYIALFNKHDVGSMRFRNMVTKKTYILNTITNNWAANSLKKKQATISRM